MDEQLKAKIKQLDALVAEIKSMTAQQAQSSSNKSALISPPPAQPVHTPKPQQPPKPPVAPPVQVPQEVVKPAPAVSAPPTIKAVSEPALTETPAMQNPAVVVESPALIAEDKAPIPEGEVGVFDGEFVHMGNEKKYQVPPNYVSKSVLVLGDKLQLVAHGDQNKFKIVEQVEREELSGILTKKDNQWVILTDAGEFRVVAASIRFYEGEIGDTVEIVLPKNFRESHPLWGAVKKVHRKNPNSKPSEESSEDVKPSQYQPRQETQPQQTPSPALKPRVHPPTEKPKPRIPEPTKPVIPFASEPALQNPQPKPETLVIEPTEGSAQIEIQPVSDADIPDLR